MIARFLPTALAALVLAATSFAAQTVNVDELPHKAIDLPNGSRAVVIVYNEHNWREVDASVLAGDDARDPDICFEAKFDSVVQPDKVKLFGLPGTLIADDRIRQKAAADFKRGDNAWFCGTLRRGRDGKSVELVLHDILKLPADLQRYEARITTLEKRNDPESLIELGHKIEQQRNQNIGGFSDFDKLGQLKDRAFEVGLTLKEKQLKADDADGLFALALQWRDLRRKNARFRELVQRCLQADPDHPKASRVAEEELGMQKFEGRWLHREEAERIAQEREAVRVRQDAARRAELEARARERDAAVANRPLLLLTYQAALRGSDPKARENAMRSLGEAIQQSPDSGFGELAVDLLANLADSATANIGLDLAGHSSLPEVRRQVLEALIWRGGNRDAQAFATASALLKAERDTAVVHAAVEALVATQDKNKNAAAQALIQALPNPERSARDEIMEGLKIITKQPHSTREAWEAWWAKNGKG